MLRLATSLANMANVSLLAKHVSALIECVYKQWANITTCQLATVYNLVCWQKQHINNAKHGKGNYITVASAIIILRIWK